MQTTDEVGWALTPEQLKAWRLSRPGRHKTARHTTQDGWSQGEAAQWIGVHRVTWNRWETGQCPIPLYVKKMVLRKDFTFDEVIDRVFNTPKDVVEQQGGVYPEFTPSTGDTE